MEVEAMKVPHVPHLTNRARFVLALVLVFLTLFLWAAVGPVDAAESPEVAAQRAALEASLTPQPDDDLPITIEMGVTVGMLRLSNLYYVQWAVEAQGRIDMSTEYKDLADAYASAIEYLNETRGKYLEQIVETNTWKLALGIAVPASLAIGILIGLVLK
jgi:hypothetical protein